MWLTAFNFPVSKENKTNTRAKQRQRETKNEQMLIIIFAAHLKAGSIIFAFSLQLPESGGVANGGQRKGKQYASIQLLDAIGNALNK